MVENAISSSYFNKAVTWVEKNRGGHQERAIARGIDSTVYKYKDYAVKYYPYIYREQLETYKEVTDRAIDLLGKDKINERFPDFKSYRLFPDNPSQEITWKILPVIQVGELFSEKYSQKHNGYFGYSINRYLPGFNLLSIYQRTYRDAISIQNNPVTKNSGDLETFVSIFIKMDEYFNENIKCEGVKLVTCNVKPYVFERGIVLYITDLCASLDKLKKTKG
jgi:hypothetical protein